MKNRDAVLMRVADVYENESTCDRNHVGAVIAIEGRVIGTGYNGAPAGMPHCDHTCTCPKVNPATGRRIVRMLNTPGQHDNDCPAESACRVAVHAEANAIAFCAKHGLPTNGATLYTTLSPCYPCAQLIINAGVVRVVFDRGYRDVSGIHLLYDAGVSVVIGENA